MFNRQIVVAEVVVVVVVVVLADVVIETRISMRCMADVHDLSQYGDK